MTKLKKIINEEIENITGNSGVNFLYQQQPELANIGTKEQYSQYLDTIFPNSILKDIVYHSSPNKIDTFRQSMFGVYFSYSPIHDSLGGNIIPAVLNIKNLLIKPNPDDNVETKIKYDKDYRSYNNPTSFSLDGTKTYKYDASLEGSTVTKDGAQIRVRNSEQIHILGSKEDTEMFRQSLVK